MKNLLISGGAAAGIVCAIIAVIIVAVVAVLLIKNKNGFSVTKNKPKFIEPKLDNSQLLTEVAVEKIYPEMTVIVPPTHDALVIKNGTISGINSGGEIKLTSLNRDVNSLKVLYISKTAKLSVLWGTKKTQRFEYVDPKIGKPVSVGAFGVMDIRVNNPQKFYLELVANFGRAFEVDDLQDRIRPRVADKTVEALNIVFTEAKISYVDFSASKYEVQERVESILSRDFTERFGFEVCDFIIENVNIPEEAEAEIKQIYSEDSDYEREIVRAQRRRETAERVRMDERLRMEDELDVADLEDALYKRKTARARDETEYERKLRHEDENRAWAREDKSRDTSVGVQEKVIDAYKAVEISRSEAMKSVAVTDALKSAGRHCTVCGTEYKSDDKYCPACGAVIPRENISAKCSACGATVAWGTPYCSNCGNKLGK